VDRAAAADRQLWLMAVVPDNQHKDYVAKQELNDASGTQSVPIDLKGAAIGSKRDLVVVSAGPGEFRWLKLNHQNDGNSNWDIHRVSLRGIPEISRPYLVTKQC
jgi:hypothetical protein